MTIRVGDTVRLTARAAKGLTTHRKSQKPWQWPDAWKKDAVLVARPGEVNGISRDGRTVYVRWSGRKSNETYAVTAVEAVI